ncbi:phosphotransferase system glucose-specific IIA component [Mycoplasma wenyonii str. Massachusetts]|uniref:Phosphotransferase system glucose-specific IIA component n=1 Tax=Mycoplasma wenyonii (strain Massachusetts) TaxID=1197325 RepID=I6ZI34_MYCWM|nr:PTS glucose transporter subunit IIA [Mycoplasma wenyonii]AFN64820.1 phosphotransferase system glucose-specific IIA component [Mycoplasma wenyonii str. Massachusetts]
MKQIFDFLNKFASGKKVITKKEEAPKSEIKIYSPLTGAIIDQKNIPDEGFSEGYMGVGVGIQPKEDEDVWCPLSGNLEVLFKTQHAYIVREPNTQVAVMLHLGINTVNIAPELKAFTTPLTQGLPVKEKDPLCKMSLEVIRKNATSDISALLVQNENMEGKEVKVHKKEGESVTKGELIMSIYY